MRALLGLVLLCATGIAGAGDLPERTRGLELLMFDAPDCSYCAQWEADVGGVYARTEEGRAAPLRRVAIHAPLPAGLALAEQPRYTPTFVLVREGHEIGRITGYAGNEHFWGLLGGLLAQAAH